MRSDPPLLLQARELILLRLQALGYKTNLRWALLPGDEEFKRLNVMGHSEKMCMAYLDLVLPPGQPMRVMKNLRICGGAPRCSLLCVSC